MTKVLVTINHALTTTQLDELSGVDIVYLKDVNPALFGQLAETPADENEICRLAETLEKFLVHGGFNKCLLPIGSPAFMFSLARTIGYGEGYESGVDSALKVKGVYRGSFIFSHTERKSVEETQPDGSVRKSAIFNHVRFLTF